MNLEILPSREFPNEKLPVTSELRLSLLEADPIS